MGSWNKFLLLTWKNWLLQWRRPIQTIVEIIAPVVFSIILVIIRSLVEPEVKPPITFSPFDPLGAYKLQDIQYNRIIWSPCDNQMVNELMIEVLATNNHTGECRPNGGLLQLDMLLNTLNTLVGVEFEPNFNLNENMRVTLRFPGELRTSSGSWSNWQTNRLFPLFQTPGPRTPSSNVGLFPSYYQEGFIGIQKVISHNIMKLLIGDEVDDISINMQRFPHASWIDDPLLTALESFVGIIIMLSFVYTCINATRMITTEKEKQLKEAMKIMGLPNWLHWTAWFVKIYSYLFISIVLMVVFLTVSWYPGTSVSVFTHSNPFVLLIFMMFYMLATVTFCFAISVFFSKANTAATVAGLFWFLSYCPYLFLQEGYDELSLTEKLLPSLASNTAMAFGFRLIIMHEGTGEGIQWHNLFEPVTPDDDLSLGLILMMFFIDALIYLLIALYVESVFPGEYGIPLVWYYPFTASYWRKNKQVFDGDHSASKIDPSDVYEKEPNLNAGIQIRNLRKVYSNKKVAVRNLSMNMYEGQITVLLGHNGAGKTTTMSMLTGMFPPSSGTAIVNGYDIRLNMPEIRDSLGLCPQHNILFDDLTVSEHLRFFCKLKGLKDEEVTLEIEKYIDLLEFQTKRNEKSSVLSGGMKRKLCVGIALCGKSRICLFDEPTAGVDPSARRALWDLLKVQKQDRTILLSTHFMDEADLLGDRIAIMAGGHLQCCGSSFFLKKKYGAGYHLVMDKSLKCNVDEVTNLLQKYIPDVSVESNVGSELTYVLSENHSTIFQSMLSDLETNGKILGINSYGISLTTLEEVFMKAGADHGQEEENDALETKQEKVIDLNSNGNDFVSNMSDPIIPENYLTGFGLWRNQFHAMMMKKILSTLRTWILFIIQNVIPVAFLIIAIVVIRTMNQDGNLPSFEFTLDSYNNPITVTESDDQNNALFTTYQQLLQNENRIVFDWSAETLTRNMLEMTTFNPSAVRMRYIIGASFENNREVIAWFNNDPLHSPPLALQYVTNTILKERQLNQSITFVNHPLPFMINTMIQRLTQQANLGFQVAFNIGFSMAFVSSFYILFCIRERVVKSKHLQFVSGINVTTFWISAYLWDMIMFIFTSLLVIGTLAAFQEEGFQTFAQLARVFVVLLMFGLAMLPMMYLSSFLFTVPSTGFARITFVNIFTGVAAFMVVQVMGVEQLELVHVADILHLIFLIMPHYSLTNAIFQMYFTFTISSFCEMINNMGGSSFDETTVDYACNMNEMCCDVQEDYFAWGDGGIGKNLVYTSIVTIVLVVILLLNEYRLFEIITYKIKGIRNVTPPNEGTEDSDVLEEKSKIRTTNASNNQYNLLLKDMTKYYGNFLAVNQLCLGVSNYECFGLLGVNGAGKTTTFKMMTGDEDISSGDGWICGLNLKTDVKEVHKIIGYCPQFDALLDDLTGRETLTMYCLLRGIRYKESVVIAEQLSRDFDFHRHFNKKVKDYSGGNKRKLSSALAFIGDPKLIFLDEPTTGMDPATKRNLWNTLCKMRDNGKCLVLTSHSMEECEALCTRLAIMVNGSFKCLGSTQHLKNKFSQGYTLTIKMHKRDEDENDVTEAVEHFVKEKFPSATLREKHEELVTFYISDTSVPWSEMFGIMENEAKPKLMMEDYFIGQSSLEQVFLSLSKMQRE